MNGRIKEYSKQALFYKEKMEREEEGRRAQVLLSQSHERPGYATRTAAGGASSSSGRAVIDSPAPVLLGAGAISGSGICMSS